MSRLTFAASMIGLGVTGLVYGSASPIWEPIPKALQSRSAIIFVCSVIELGAGVGLLARGSVTLACRLLVPFLSLWLVLLKLSALLRAPKVLVSWESFAEVAAPLAAAWCLLAAHPGGWEERRLGFAVGDHGIRAARLLFIASLPMIGLAHFAYPDMTASLVPKWLHFPLGWIYLTGAASVVAAVAMLLGVYPRLAANLETAMLGVITLLVWVPRVAAAPASPENWAEFWISTSIAAAAWVVADTYRRVAWLASGSAARAVRESAIRR